MMSKLYNLCSGPDKPSDGGDPGAVHPVLAVLDLAGHREPRGRLPRGRPRPTDSLNLGLSCALGLEVEQKKLVNH